MEKSRRVAVNMLQDGVDTRIVTTITSLEEEDVLEIKNLMGIGYGENIFDIERARRVRRAKSLTDDGVPMEIVKTLTKLTASEAVFLER